MKNQIITEIMQAMLTFLDNRQMEQLNEVLKHTLYNCTIQKDSSIVETKEDDRLNAFIALNRVEGCSEKSLLYFESTIQNMLKYVKIC